MIKLNTKGLAVVESVLIVVLMGLIVGVGYYVYQSKQNDKVAVSENPPTAEDKNSEPEKIECVNPSEAVVQNTKESIMSGNTAALEGYMTAKVEVIFAVSGGLGERTAAEAVGDVTSFIVDTTDWDFDLDKPELAGYQSGDYKKYFPSSAVVGKSAEKKLISFTYNCEGKISGVFASSSTDIL